MRVKTHEDDVAWTPYPGYLGPFKPKPLERIQASFSNGLDIDPNFFSDSFFIRLMSLINHRHGTNEKKRWRPRTADRYEWRASIPLMHAERKYRFFFPKVGSSSDPENEVTDRHVAMYIKQTTAETKRIAEQKQLDLDDLVITAPAEEFTCFYEEAFRRHMFEQGYYHIP